MVLRVMVVFLLVLTGLAGCTTPEPVAEVVRVEPAKLEPSKENVFVLFGKAQVNDSERHLDLVVKHNNRIVDVVDYRAKPNEDHKTLKTYLLPEGTVRLEVVEDRNVVLAAQIDPDECPQGRADMIVEVEDRRHLYDGSIRIDYGCTA